MEQKDVELLVKELMKKYKLDNWKFKFDNSKRRFGCCHYGIRTISLSLYLCKLNNYDKVKDTILHEIAHALTKGYYHNNIWKAKAVEIGCNGKRCYDSIQVTKPKPNVIYECPECHIKLEKYRVFTQASACKECCDKYNRGKYSKKFIYKLIWTRKYDE